MCVFVVHKLYYQDGYVLMANQVKTALKVSWIKIIYALQHQISS